MKGYKVNVLLIKSGNCFKKIGMSRICNHYSSDQTTITAWASLHKDKMHIKNIFLAQKL